jgi:TonB family C-terminal domain
MKPKVDIYNTEWVEMVFEGKNQQYGAYVLRKSNSKRHLKAFLISATLFVLAISAPLLAKYLIPKKHVEENTVIELSKLQMKKAPEEIKKAVLAPPPPPARNTIKFVPPIIKPDDQVNEEEEMVTQDKVMESTAAVGAVNFDKGTDDVTVAPAQTTIAEESTEPFIIVEEMPEFPGGTEEMMKFLGNNIRYPVIAQENGIQGMVILSFVVSKTGQISDIQVVRGLGSGCDEEAVRVVKKMPNWKPGKQGGAAVPVKFTLPVRFALK